MRRDHKEEIKNDSTRYKSAPGTWQRQILPKKARKTPAPRLSLRPDHFSTTRMVFAFHSISRNVRRCALVFIGLLVGAVLWLLWRWPVLPWIAWAQRWVQHLGPMSVIAYPLLYALCNVLLLPGSILTVGAGFFFGLGWGVAIILTGNLFGASVAFLIARTLARQWFERRMLANLRLQALDALVGEHGGRIVFLSQLHPLFPTSLLNYFYGVTRLRFWPCLGWIALGQSPGIFLYVYLGTLGQYGVRWWQNGSTLGPVSTTLWIVGWLVCLGASLALAQLSKNLLRELDQRAATLPT
jgi:uncharacterized membrane protein YdjX (TVP38/TMEM64 family)